MRRSRLSSAIPNDASGAGRWPRSISTKRSRLRSRPSRRRRVDAARSAPRQPRSNVQPRSVSIRDGRASDCSARPRSPTSWGSARWPDRMVAEAQQLGLGAAEAARLAWLRQMISGDVWREAGATKVFVAIARAMSDGGDLDMALARWSRSRIAAGGRRPAPGRGPTSSTRRSTSAYPTTMPACSR